MSSDTSHPTAEPETDEIAALSEMMVSELNKVRVVVPYGHLLHLTHFAQAFLIAIEAEGMGDDLQAQLLRRSVEAMLQQQPAPPAEAAA